MTPSGRSAKPQNVKKSNAEILLREKYADTLSKMESADLPGKSTRITKRINYGHAQTLNVDDLNGDDSVKSKHSHLLLDVEGENKLLMMHNKYSSMRVAKDSHVLENKFGVSGKLGKSVRDKMSN